MKRSTAFKPLYRAKFRHSYPPSPRLRRGSCRFHLRIELPVFERRRINIYVRDYMNITKLSLLFSLSLASALTLYAGENTDKDKYLEQEKNKIFNCITNALISGKLGKSVPLRMAGIAWLGYEASNYTLQKKNTILTLSDLKLVPQLPFYHAMKLDVRFLQEQYIKKLQMKQPARKHTAIVTLNRNETPTLVSQKKSQPKQSIKPASMTVEFKKTKHQQEKLPESVSFLMDSNPFSSANTREDKALLSSKHIFLTDGINRGRLLKI